MAKADITSRKHVALLLVAETGFQAPTISTLFVEGRAKPLKFFFSPKGIKRIHTYIPSKKKKCVGVNNSCGRQRFELRQ
jgi:hypothetical protein